MAVFNGVPSLDEFLARPDPNAVTLATPQRPTFDFIPTPTQAPVQAPQRNLFAAGLSAGVDQLQGSLGSLAAAAGQATGIQSLRDWGAGIAERNEREAAASGRPDLEIAPWREGGGGLAGLPGYVAYQATKNLVNLGPAVAGAVAGGPLSAALGLGRVATALGPQLTGAIVGGVPTAAGQMFGSALDRERETGDRATTGEALASLALSPVYAGLDALAPARVLGAVTKGTAGSLPSRMFKEAVQAGAREMPTEAAQTALEMGFRPDLSLADKSRNVVDAAITGGLVGGVFGAAGGIRSAKVSGLNSPNDELKAATDGPLGLSEQPAVPQGPALLTGPNWQGAELQPETSRLGGLGDEALQANRGRIEQRLFEGEQTPGLARELQAYREEENRRAFSSMDDQALADNFASLRARLDAGEQNTGLATRAQAVEAELARRQAVAARVPEQGLMFGEQDLVQPSLAATTAPPRSAPGLTSVQSYAADILSAGKPLRAADARYIQTLDARNDIALAQRVYEDAARTKAASSPALRLAEALGLTESESQFEARQRVAQQALTDAQIDLAAGNVTPDAVASMQAVVDRLSTQKALRDAVRQPDGTPGGEQRAPSAALPPLPQTGLTPTQYTPEQLAMRFEAQPTPSVAEVQGELPLALGRQTTEPVANPQTFEATAKFLQRVAGVRSTKAIQDLGRATVPDAVAQVSRTVSDPKWNKDRVITRIAEYFGLVDDRKNPISIETAIANTERELQPLEQRYAAGERVSEDDIERSRQLTERRDALRAAQQVQAIDQTITVPGVAPDVRAQGRAARAQVTGQFPEPTIQSALRATPFPDAVEQAPAPAQPAAAPEPVMASPTARPAPTPRRTQASVQAEREAAAAAPAETPAAAPQEDLAIAPAASVNDSERVTTQAAATVAQSARNLLSSLGQAFSNKQNFNLSLLKNSLGWASTDEIQNSFDQPLGGAIGRLQDGSSFRKSVRNVFANLTTSVTDDMLVLEQNAEMRQRMGDTIAATAQKIRPGATWEQQPHLHDQPNATELKRLVAKTNENVRWLKQKILDPKVPEGQRKTLFSVYERALARNEIDIYSRVTHLIQQTAVTTGAASNPALQTNSVTTFVSDPELQSDVIKARDWWKKQFDATVAAAEEQLTSDKSNVALRALAKTAKSYDARMKESPYFYLGRYGNFYVSMDVATKGGAKNPDPAALQKLASAMSEAGFEGAVIPETAGTNRVFIRLEEASQQVALQKLAQDLEKQGVVSKVKTGTRGDSADVSANAGQAANTLASSVKAQMEKRLDSIKDPAVREQLKKTQEMLLAALDQAALELEPDNSIKRVLVPRKGVSGFSGDFVRNFASRLQIGGDAFANIASAPRIAKALADLDTAVRDEPDAAQQQKLAVVRDELSLRTAQSIQPYNRSVYDTMASVSYAMLMSSPASAILQLTSLSSMVLPKLAAQHGFVKSATAMAKAAPTAIRALNAVVAHSFKPGWKRGADIVFTPDALADAKISPEQKRFISQAVIGNLIDMGAPAREMGRLSDERIDSKTDAALRYATFMTSYTETLSRLLTALTVRELNGDTAIGDQIDSARTVINSSLFNFDSTNTPRLTGRNGAVGPASRVVLQFANFQLMLLQAVGRAMITASGLTSRSAAEVSEARKFFAYHSAMVATIAGSLGLPFFTVGARLFEAVAEALSDDGEPVDVETAIFNFLTDTFGPGMGEVLARGLPRAFGADVSPRAGEQDLLPFSRFIADRRKLEDKYEDLAKDMLGAPTSVAAGFILGARDIADGKWREGIKQMIPGAFKGPVEAGYMLADGTYTNSRGQQLPITPSTADAFVRAIGFTPSNKALYDEANLAKLTRQGLLTREGAGIRDEAVRAFQSGDATAFQAAIGRAAEFDRNNPTYAVSPTIAAALTRRETDLATARATRTALDTRLKDTGSVNAQRFAEGAYR